MSLLDMPDQNCLLREKLKTRLAVEYAQCHQHETLPPETFMSDTLASSSSSGGSSGGGNRSSSSSSNCAPSEENDETEYTTENKKSLPLLHT